MGEFKLIEMLADRDIKRKVAAREFLGRIKTAAIKDLASTLLKTHGDHLAAGLGGAAVAVGTQYILNRERDGKPSLQQVFSQRNLSDALARKAEAKREHRPMTFNEEVSVATTPALANLSDVMAKHPARGALSAIPVGVGMGMLGLAGLKFLKSLA
jgi:hypothetical protein